MSANNCASLLVLLVPPSSMLHHNWTDEDIGNGRFINVQQLYDRVPTGAVKKSHTQTLLPGPPNSFGESNLANLTWPNGETNTEYKNTQLTSQYSWGDHKVKVFAVRFVCRHCGVIEEMDTLNRNLHKTDKRPDNLRRI